jgi:hypothetical protein
MIAVPTRTMRWRLPALVLIVIAIVAVWGLLRQGDAVEVLTAPVMYQDPEPAGDDQRKCHAHQ